MAEGNHLNSAENEYPWGKVPRTASFSNETEFQAFISVLQAATKTLSSTCHFDSLTSLIDLHTRFRSSSNGDLEETWKNFPEEDCAIMKEMTCVGLALTLKELIVRDHPELEDCIALGITNEWTSTETVTESFWTSTTPPSFPLQCREHSLLFIRVSLSDGRKAVVFLDPGRCLGTPMVATEDGLPPQSSRLVFKRYKKTREHSVSWGGSKYMRWTIGTRKEDSYVETHLRVYVERHFDAGSYLDKHNLIFPFRAVMFMTSSNGLELCLRVEIGKTFDHVIVLLVDENEDLVNQLIVPFESEHGNWDKDQKSAIHVLSGKYGEQKLVNLLCSLKKVLEDRDFCTKLLAIWDRVKQETEDSIISSSQ